MVDSIQVKNQKIVIIESDDSVGQQILDIIKKDGYKDVYLYKNGEQGFKGMCDVLPHLVLLDIVLSDIDGYTVLAKKMAEPLLVKIPVFLLSTHGVAINMRNIPPNSVSEVIISLNTKSFDILQKVNEYFGYGLLDVADKTNSLESEKKKILWIEDDRLIGNILKKKIISSGFDLTHVQDGTAALESLKTIKPDVIVADLILPGMDGFELIEAINKDKNMEDVPKMILSNVSKTGDIDRAKSLGVKKYLVKASTSLDQVIVEIKSLCK